MEYASSAAAIFGNLGTEPTLFPKAKEPYESIASSKNGELKLYSLPYKGFNLSLQPENPSTHFLGKKIQYTENSFRPSMVVIQL